MEDLNPLQNEESHVSETQLRAIPSTANVRPPEYLLPDVMHPLVPFLHVSTNEMDSVVFSCFQWQNDHSICKK